MSLGVILKVFQPQLLQKQKDKGVHQAETQRPLGKGFMHQKISQNTQGHIDQQRHIGNAEPCFVLYHGGNTVDAGGSKPVFHDKQLIIKGQKNRQKNNLPIGEHLLHRLGLHPTTIPSSASYRVIGLL